MMVGDAYSELRKLSRLHVLMRAGVAVHGLAFVIASVGMLALDFLTSGTLRWSPFPVGAWSIGLAAHAVAVAYRLSTWFERNVDRETERLRRSRV
jgi:hypothetical protein